MGVNVDALELLTLMGAQKDMTARSIEVIKKIANAYRDMSIDPHMDIEQVFVNTPLFDGILGQFIDAKLQPIQIGILANYGLTDAYIFYLYNSVEVDERDGYPFILSLPPIQDETTDFTINRRHERTRLKQYIESKIALLSPQQKDRFYDIVSLYEPLLDLIENADVLRA